MRYPRRAARRRHRGRFLRTLRCWLLLPAEAFTALGAIVRALWRMAVSPPRALDWETAAESSPL